MGQATLQEIPIEFLCRGRFQTRVQFTDQELNELSDSIKRNGLVQPIVVRPLQDNKYEIVAGERRWRAAQRAGLHTVSCLKRDYTDEQSAAVTAIENLNRVDLNPIEEAEAYQKLIAEFEYSHEDAAAAVGKSRTKITNTLRLLALNDRIKQALIAGDLSEGHGKILVGLGSQQSLRYAQICIAKKLSVRQLEKLIKQEASEKVAANKDIDIARLEQNISEALGCPAKIIKKAGGFSIELLCYELDVLNGVVNKICAAEQDENLEEF